MCLIAYLSYDPRLGLVGIIDDFGVLRNLLLAAGALVEVRPDAAAVLAHNHLARAQVGLGNHSHMMSAKNES